MRRDTGALNTSANQAESAPAWKQEVNRRLAAYKRRMGISAELETPLEDQHAAGSRSAEVAARVAARYAQAPSYSALLTDEARAAVRAAEAVSRAALQAQAAAESVLAGLEAASEAEIAQARAAHGPRIFEISVPGGRESYECASDPAAAFDGIEIADAAQPMPANLIEFPVELDTTRKVRPRRDERPSAVEIEPERQLNIFEVDPGSILIQPEPVDAVNEAVATAWTGSEWLGIELEEERVPEEIAPQADSRASALYPAPIHLRMMAAVVDVALIAGACVAFALAAAIHAQVLPAVREIELGAAVALAVAGLLYQAIFFTLAGRTPGMKYADISMCTFDDQIPICAQRLGRLGALLLSLLPVGLGVAWAIFDEERLSWHDRLSRTYLRKG
jgi:uncharacterized RDD family membrane protein YckC